MIFRTLIRSYACQCQQPGCRHCIDSVKQEEAGWKQNWEQAALDKKTEQEANNKSIANWALQLHDTLSASIEQELEVVHIDFKVFNQFASLQAVLNKAQTDLIDINNNLATSPENRLPALMKQGLDDLFKARVAATESAAAKLLGEMAAAGQLNTVSALQAVVSDAQAVVGCYI